MGSSKVRKWGYVTKAKKGLHTGYQNREVALWQRRASWSVVQASSDRGVAVHVS